MLSEWKTMLGQGVRDGGEPAARATEDNAGPAWFPSHPQGISRASDYFEDNAPRLAATERFPYAIYFIWDEVAGLVTVRRVLHFKQDRNADL